MLEICVVCREFLAFKYVFIVFFETDQMIIYCCISEILKTRVWNQFFGAQYPFVFVLAGREYKMDFVLSKNGVKCAVFKISDIKSKLNGSL